MAIGKTPSRTNAIQSFHNIFIMEVQQKKYQSVILRIERFGKICLLHVNFNRKAIKTTKPQTCLKPVSNIYTYLVCRIYIILSSNVLCTLNKKYKRVFLYTNRMYECATHTHTHTYNCVYSYKSEDVVFFSTFTYRHS